MFLFYDFYSIYVRTLSFLLVTFAPSENGRRNYIRYQMTNTPQDHDAYMDLAAEEWHDEIRDVLSDPERVLNHRTLGLEAMSTLEQRIDFCYSEFYNFLLSNLKNKSI